MILYSFFKSMLQTQKNQWKQINNTMEMYIYKSAPVSLQSQTQHPHIPSHICALSILSMYKYWILWTPCPLTTNHYLVLPQLLVLILPLLYSTSSNVHLHTHQTLYNNQVLIIVHAPAMSELMSTQVNTNTVKKVCYKAL